MREKLGARLVRRVELQQSSDVTYRFWGAREARRAAGAQGGTAPVDELYREGQRAVNVFEWLFA